MLKLTFEKECVDFITNFLVSQTVTMFIFCRQQNIQEVQVPALLVENLLAFKTLATPQV